MDSCGEFLTNIGGSQGRSFQSAYRQWSLGFITGHNMTVDPMERQANPPDGDSVLPFLENYCRRNPLHYLRGGLQALVAETGGSPVRFTYQK